MSNQLNSRREFLQFMGRAGLVTAGLGMGGFSLWGCDSKEEVQATGPEGLAFVPLPPISSDELVLAAGFSYHVVAKWGDPLNSEGLSFGTHADYTAYLPLDPTEPTEGLLWVNHEYTDPMLVSRYAGGDKTEAQVRLEQDSVGGSIVRIMKLANGKWQVVQGDALNRRLTARSTIPFAWPQPIAGATEAIGTMANCSGGTTPWGTVLTCEENYDQFYGERDHKTGEKAVEGDLQWERFGDCPPEHYGWVVEVDLLSGEAKKLVALGRCMHECATVHALADGRCVVYTGDDANDEHLYKFVGTSPHSLEEGKLYVANTEKGQWVSLQYEEQEVLREAFADQTEVLVRLREAAKLVGGTPLDRPEDIEIDPATGHVLVTLTNNKPKGNYHGHFLKIEEEGGEQEALAFTASTFLAGGKEAGFSCPDNICFDPKGNLWFCSDISGSQVGKGKYAPFKNNGLFYVPMSGALAGQVFQVGSAPMDAELTGITFAPDGETLFVCVQHPGETSKSLDKLTSHWPEGGDSLPRSAVVAITGEPLKALLA